MDWVVCQSDHTPSFAPDRYEVYQGGEFSLGWVPSGNLRLLERQGEPSGVVSGQLFGPLADTGNVADSQSKEELGDLALRSDGSFAAAILRNEKVTLVSDAGGSIPVFFGYGPKGFAMGTLVHHVAALSGLDSLDKVSAVDYLLNGTICYPHSWFKGIREVPPGSVCSFSSREKVEHHTYWEPTEPDGVREDCDSEKWGRRLREQVEEAIRLGTKGKSKGRVLYSGGVDSRAVLSLVPSSFNCIPTTVTDYKNQEYRIAKRSAQLLGRELEWIRRPEDHYRSSIRELIDKIGPGWV